MYTISVVCHHCGRDNPADSLHCAECQTALRLRPTTTTQLLRPVSDGETSEEGLIREAYLVGALLLQSAHRLRALLNAKTGKQ